MKLHTKEKWTETIRLIVEAINRGELTPEEAVEQLGDWGWILIQYPGGTSEVTVTIPDSAR